MAYTYSFTGVGVPSSVLRSDGVEFPQDPGNLYFGEWQVYVAGGGVTSAAAAPTLAQAKTRAAHLIDQRAADVRAAYAHEVDDDDLYHALRLKEAADRPDEVSARGVRFHGNGAYATHTLVGTPLDYGASGDFSICGWMAIRADQGSGDARNTPFYLGTAGFNGVWFQSGDVASPWDMDCTSHNGNDPDSTQAIAANVANGEAWYWCAAYDHTTGLWTFYAGKDGDTDLAEVTAVGDGWSQNPTVLMLAAAGNGTTKSLDGDVTNVVAWTRKLTKANFLAQMKSAAVVDPTAIYDHWPLLDASDLAGAVNGRTFVLTGAVSPGVGDGTIAPADIASGGSTSDAGYPLLTSEVGVGANWTGASVEEVRDAVRAEDSALREQLALIETTRATGHAAVVAAADVPTLERVVGDTVFSTPHRRRVGVARLAMSAPAVTLDRPRVLMPGPAYLALVALMGATSVSQILQPAPAVFQLVAPPLLGGTGWTEFQYSVDSRLIHVANAGLDVAPGDGTEAHPYRTIAHARTFMRDGYPDWILLKRGDTFVETLGANWNLSGRNAFERMGFDAYGTGARPIVDSGLASSFWSWNAHCSHVAIFSLKLVASTYDATNGSPTGIGVYGAQSNVLIEDCEVTGFATNIVLEAHGGRHSGFAVRRCVVTDAWCADDQFNCQGIFAGQVDGLLIEENCLDQNGWRESGVGNVRTFFRHNLYSIENTGVIVRGNFSTGTDALQMRSGATCTGNVCARTVAGLMFGKTDIPNPGGVTVVCTGNAVIEQRPMSAAYPACFGYILTNVVSGVFADNIAANFEGGDQRAVWFPAQPGYAGPIAHDLACARNVAHHAGRWAFDGQEWQYSHVTINDCVSQWAGQCATFQVPTILDPIFLTGGGNSWADLVAGQDHWFSHGGTDVSLADFLAAIGDTTSVAGPVTYSAPTRNLGSYYLSIGGTNDHDAFLAACRLQRKGAWRDDLMAAPAIAHIRDGFDL